MRAKSALDFAVLALAPVHSGLRDLAENNNNGNKLCPDLLDQLRHETRALLLEFQHSCISDQERRSREEFHRPMYWIVDGQRLKRDRPRFIEALRYGRVASFRPWTMIAPIGECVLLRKWADSRVPVFFDFGESDEGGEVYRFGAPILWGLEPGRQRGLAVLKPVFRQKFIDAMLKGEHPRGIVFAKAFERALQISVPSRPPHPQSFEAHLERKRRARAWKRF